MKQRFLKRLAVGVGLLAFLSGGPFLAASQVIISEFMARNETGLADEEGEVQDWIELLNIGSSTVNLLDWSLTDDADNLNQWRFPATNLPPAGFIVVFASEKDRRIPGAPLHTNFRLAGDKEYLALVEPDGVRWRIAARAVARLRVAKVEATRTGHLDAHLH